MYKFFCTKCPWTARRIYDLELWGELRHCPRCKSATDAVQEYGDLQEA